MIRVLIAELWVWRLDEAHCSQLGDVDSCGKLLDSEEGEGYFYQLGCGAELGCC